MPPNDPAVPSNLAVSYENGALAVTWDAASVPAGYTVEVVVTNDRDGPLAPIPTVTLNGPRAAVTGTAVRGGAKLRVKLLAVPGIAIMKPVELGRVGVELVTLAAAAEPRLSLTPDGLDIRWTAVASATDYEVEAVVGSAPPPRRPTLTRFGPADPYRARIDASELADRTTYEVRVRATAGVSRGPWSAAAAITYDRPNPASPLLRALLDRLRAAGPAFDLGPDVVRSGNITSQFRLLLGAAGDKLSVRGATVACDATSVTLTAALDLAGVTGAVGTFVFTHRRSVLQLDLKYPMGTQTIARLKAAKLLPDDIFKAGGSGPSTWVDGLAAIDGAVLKLDTAARVATVTADGNGPTWSVLGLQNVSLLPVKPQLQVISDHPARPNRYIPRVTTEIDLGLASKLPVYLQLPSGYTPWQVGLTSPWYVGNITDLARLFAGHDLDLPDGLVSLGQFTLNAFTMTHPPAGKTWTWDLAATLGPVPGQAGSQPPRWKIIDGELELEKLGATLHVDVMTAGANTIATTSGTVSARFTLGTLTPIDAVLSIPGVDGAWTLVAATDQSLELNQTAQLMGGDRTALKSALDTLGATTGFTLERLEIAVKPAAPRPELTRLVIAVRIKSWTVPSLSRFQVDAIAARLTILNPAQGSRVITGELRAVLTLGTAKAGVIVSFERNAVWSLSLTAQPAQLAGLDDLSSLVTPAAVTGQLPPGLPTSAGFQMGALGLRYDSQNHYFPTIAFALKSGLGWTVVPDVLELDGIEIAIDVVQASAAAEKVVTGHVSGWITLAGVPLRLSASKPQGTDPWSFSGAIEGSKTLDFNTLLHEKVSKDWSIPSGYGFPTSLTILAAEATLVPSTGAFDFSSSTLVDWSFSVGSKAFAVKSLGGWFHRAGTGDTTPTSAAVYGTFELSDKLTGEATVQLGAAGVDTIVQVALTASADTSRFQVGTTADQLTGATDASQFARIVPARLPTELSGLGVSINLTKGVYLLTGTLVRFGWAYLLYQSAPTTQPAAPGPGPPSTAPAQTATVGYVFAAGLGNGFKFGNLLAELAPVDDIVTVKDAMLAVYSVTSGTLDGLKRSVAPFQNLPTTVRWPLPDAPGIDLPPARGLILSATIEVQTPKLFDRVLQIGTVSGTGSGLSLAAVIDRDTPAQSVYVVRVPDIVFLATIRLTGVVVTFRPAKNNELTVAGGLTIPNVFGENYTFRGSLTLTSAAMKGSLDLIPTDANKKVDRPFGIPGIVIDQLKVGVETTFAGASGGSPPGTPTTPATTTGTTKFALLGKVRLGRPPAVNTTDQRIAFQAKLGLVGGEPVLMSIALDRDLDIGGFLAQCFTGDGANWPDNFINITFKAGSRVYNFREIQGSDAWKNEPASDNLPAYTYEPGFNVDAHVVLTLVTDIDLRFTLNSVAGTDGKPGGVKASVSLKKPIDLLFVQLAGSALVVDAYTGGPTLDIVTRPSKTFGFTAGVNFFGKGLADVTVGISRSAGNDTLVGGRVHTASSLPVFGNLAFEFLYTRKAAGQSTFAITNWPAFDVLDQLINIVNEIRNLASAARTPGCGALADLVINPLLKTRYSVTPTADAAGDNLSFSLTVACSMSIGDNSNTFLTRALPAITVLVPKSTQFTGLASKLTQGIADAGPRFVADLLRQPEKISLFLAMVFGQRGVSIALDLACRSLVDAAVASATEAAAGVLAGAGGAAAAGAATILAAAAAASTSISSHRSDPGPSPGDTTPRRPSMTGFAYDLSGFTGRWTGAAYAASYEFEVSGPQFGPVQAQPFTALTNSLPVAATSIVAGTYSGRVRGVRELLRGPWSDPATIALVPVPSGLTLVFDAAARALDANWTAPRGTGVAFTYDFELWDQHAQVAQEPNLTQPSTIVGRLSFVAGQVYRGRVRAKAGGSISVWSEMVPLRIVEPPVPTGLLLAFDGASGRLTVNWTRPAGVTAETYVLEVDGEGTWNRVLRRDRLPGTEVTVGPPEVVFQADVGNHYFSYTVRLRLVTATALSSWATARFAVPPTLPTPSLSFDGESGRLTVSWSTAKAPPMQENYILEVVEAVGEKRVQYRDGLVFPDATAQATAGPPELAFGAGVRYTVRVRVVVDKMSGAWSTGEFTAAPPAPPALGLAFDGDSGRLTVSWTTAKTPPMQETYVLEVVEAVGGKRVLYREGLVFPDTTDRAPAGPPEVTFGAGVRYTVRIRLVTVKVTALSQQATTTLLGRWATAEFTPLPAPEDAGLSFYAEEDPAASRLNASFYELNLYAYRGSNVEPATYDLRIIASGRTEPYIRAGLASPPQGDLSKVELSGAELDIGFSEGATFRASVRVVLGSVRSPWSPEKPRSRLTLVLPPVPGNVRLTYEAAKLIGTWHRDGRADTYWYTLWRGGDSNPVAGGVQPKPPVEFLRYDKVPIQPGTTYTLGVRAGVGVCYGAMGKSMISVPTADELARWEQAAGQTAPHVADALFELLSGTIFTFDDLLRALANAGYPPQEAAPAALGRVPAGSVATTTAKLRKAAYAGITEAALRAALLACRYPAADVDAAVVLVFRPAPTGFSFALDYWQYRLHVQWNPPDSEIAATYDLEVIEGIAGDGKLLLHREGLTGTQVYVVRTEVDFLPAEIIVRYYTIRLRMVTATWTSAWTSAVLDVLPS